MIYRELVQIVVFSFNTKYALHYYVINQCLHYTHSLTVWATAVELILVSYIKSIHYSAYQIYIITVCCTYILQEMNTGFNPNGHLFYHKGGCYLDANLMFYFAYQIHITCTRTLVCIHSFNKLEKCTVKSTEVTTDFRVYGINWYLIKLKLVSIIEK